MRAGKNQRRRGGWRVFREALRGEKVYGLGVGSRLLAVQRMVRAVQTGAYTGLSRSRLVLMLSAVAYVLSPIDLVPEALFFVFGLGDDALVASWAVGALLAEADAFVAWEQAATMRPSRNSPKAGSSPSRTGSAHETERDVIQGTVIRNPVVH